jgi:hypothetical protein
MKMCKNIFDIYIKTGSVVELGAKITDEFITMKPFQSRVSFPVFQSTIKCPQYTDVDFNEKSRGFHMFSPQTICLSIKIMVSD